RPASFLQPVELPRQTALGLMAARRVTAGGHTLHVLGGRRLDQQFLKSLALPTGMRALLYRNLEPEASGQPLLDAGGNVVQTSQLRPLIMRVRQSGQESLENVDGPDGPETVDAIPLTGADGTVVGVLMLASSGRELASLLSSIRWRGAAFGAIGIAFG